MESVDKRLGLGGARASLPPGSGFSAIYSQISASAPSGSLGFSPPSSSRCALANAGVKPCALIAKVTENEAEALAMEQLLPVLHEDFCVSKRQVL